MVRRRLNRPLRARRVGPRPTKFFIRPYKQGSASAKALSVALNGVLMKLHGSSYRPMPHRKVINWGSGGLPEGLNGPNYVRIAGNKKDFFQYIFGPESPPGELPRIPTFWTDKVRALAWLNWEGERVRTKVKRKVVCRTVLTGHSGEGIIIVEEGGELPTAPLYVEYIPKDEEYRVHVFNGSVIDVQRKVRDPEREPTDWAVRSHRNGFIYTRRTAEGQPHKDVSPPDVQLQAQRALAVSGLVFGAVDVVYNQKRQQAYVLEINTAPGLEGETVGVYAEAIRRHFGAGA